MSQHRTGVDARYVIAREMAERAIADPAVVEAVAGRYVTWSVDEEMTPHPCRVCGADGAWAHWRVWGAWLVHPCRSCLPAAIADDPEATHLDVEVGGFPAPSGGGE